MWASINDQRFSDFITVDRNESYLTYQEHETCDVMLHNKVRRRSGGGRRLRKRRVRNKQRKTGASVKLNPKTANEGEKKERRRKRPILGVNLDIVQQIGELSVIGTEEETEQLPHNDNCDDDGYYRGFKNLSASQLKRDSKKRQTKPAASPLKVPSGIPWNCCVL